MPLGEGSAPHGQFTINLEDKEPLLGAQGTVTLWTVTQDVSVRGVLLTMPVN